MKIKVDGEWYQSIRPIVNYLVGKFPFAISNGHRHDRNIKLFSVISTVITNKRLVRLPFFINDDL
jgi:hypothetical protein